MNAVSKLFFKMHLFLQIWTDLFHINYESSLEGPAFGVCFAWRFGEFWRFGDLFYFRQKMVIYIVTCVIIGSVTATA